METATSTDGTQIAYQKTGEGPPLLLVHGTGRDHAFWQRSLTGLVGGMTVYSIDRRGRGGSGDAVRYALDREVEDVIAVIEAANQPVYLLGHSFGAIVALETALRIDRLRSLILYEPPLSVGPDKIAPDLANRLESTLATGDREGVLVTFLREGPRYPEDEIAAQRTRPDWQARCAAAHTLPRELHAVRSYHFDPQRLAGLRVPTMLMLGGESPRFFKQAIDALHAALPECEVVELPGQHHNAMETSPELFVSTVHRFLRGNSTTEKIVSS